MYELLPGGSLDAAIRDDRRARELTWRTRVRIAACVAKALKGMRKKKDELGAAVLHFMKVNRIDEFQVGDGKLMRKNSKRTEALKKEYIIATLKTALGDETRVDAVMTEMNANRTTTELESLRRTRQGKSTV